MAYSVSFSVAARREFHALETTMRERVLRAVQRLALDPYRAPNVKALKGGGYRLRVGDYRVLYELKNDILVVLVVQIAHRREVYRRP